MQKREFEAAYGRKVNDSRWIQIEKAYMESPCLDRLDFVEELKAQKAEARFARQAEKAGIEIQRHNVTEAQFQAYILKRLKGHPLEHWGSYLEPELGNGQDKERTHIHKDGSIEYYKDYNGAFQTYYKEPNGSCWNFIYEFSPDDDKGRGFGYCYIFDTSVRQAKTA